MVPLTPAEWIAIVSSIILAFTLLALIRQTKLLSRQTETLVRSMKATTYDEIVDQNLQLNALLARMPESVIKEFETNETRLIAVSFIDHYENVFLQHELTNLPESVWPGWEKYMRERITSSAPLKSAYNDMKGTLDNNFRKYIEGSNE